MSWKFGIDLARSLENVKPLYGASGGIYSFSVNQSNSTGGAAGGTGGNTLASFLLGVPSGVVLRNTLIPYYYRWANAAGFVQNDWFVGDGRLGRESVLPISDIACGVGRAGQSGR
jgi:hypothetical protein